MKIVCLCGSTKFKKEIKQIEGEQKALGNIILSVVFSPFDDAELDEEIVMKLNRLHRAKIDCADKLIIINVGGYIGNGLRDEITYADMINKPYVYLEEVND